MNAYEITANVLNAASIVLAARNSAHTWWLGILGCAVFGYVFFEARLYADVTLQVFFIVTSAVGWTNWMRGKGGTELPVRRTRAPQLAILLVAAALAATGYGLLLRKFTNAVSPFWDSLVLTFSVLGQFLLMGRRIENWWAWLLVNTIAVPLYASRELYLTAALYAGFWINALVALIRWRKLLAPDETV